MVHGEFDLKLQEFKLRMMMQVINIISPFLAFASAYKPRPIKINKHVLYFILL
jgi:hypothetical protein